MQRENKQLQLPGSEHSPGGQRFPREDRPRPSVGWGWRGDWGGSWANSPLLKRKALKGQKWQGGRPFVKRMLTLQLSPDLKPFMDLQDSGPGSIPQQPAFQDSAFLSSQASGHQTAPVPEPSSLPASSSLLSLTSAFWLLGPLGLSLLESCPAFKALDIHPP